MKKFLFLIGLLVLTVVIPLMSYAEDLGRPRFEEKPIPGQSPRQNCYEVTYVCGTEKVCYQMEIRGKMQETCDELEKLCKKIVCSER